MNAIAFDFARWLRTEYQRCRDWLVPAIEHTDGLLTEETLFDGLLNYTYQMWPGKKSVIVTELQQFGDVKVLRLFIIGGDMKDALSLGPQIFKWAQSLGCSDVMFDGRDGWEKVSKGYGFYKVGVVMRAKISDLVQGVH